MELVTRRGNPEDRRIREATIAPKGKDMTDRLDAARERIGREIFASWSAQDVSELVRLMAQFASALEAREREP
jgi:DNA-binding MarR family transcriptional regulator